MNSLISSLKTGLRALRAFSSGKYWKRRYQRGGNSGPGSYGNLAKFKARVLNQFAKDYSINSVIEFGCGDGNQLVLASYSTYIGYDISPIAIESCRKRFANDITKKFMLISEYSGERADLTLSLDVIFHLVEDDIFCEYMHRLFCAASKFVIIYSSNQNEPIEPVSKHVRHRRFSDWVEHNLSAQWGLMKIIPNTYPYDGNSERTSFSDFFLYKRR